METGTLTRLELKFKEAMQSGEWMTRKELAKALQRPSGRLYPYDTETLGNLVDRGVIETDFHIRGLVGLFYVYRWVQTS